MNVIRAVAVVVALVASACGALVSAAPPGSRGAEAPVLLAACPVTLPEPAFMAPAPFPASPPAQYRSAWYGDTSLWTMVAPGGERWHDLPHQAGGLVQKTFWWSTAWPADREFRPAIAVSGDRLDAPGSFQAGPGTNASADFGSAMLVGVIVPEPGCWRLTASYRGSRLSVVVIVSD